MTQLHRAAVTAPLWDVISHLMARRELLAFRLVGGTALALHLGHRRSLDIDLFTDAPFDAPALAHTVRMQDQRVEENSVSGQIDGIKVDLIAHCYPWIDQVVAVEGVRLASLRDIAAMKLNAIANRGCKKDFWDVATLLRKWDVEKLLGLYRQRYPHMDDWQVVRSLAFFDDAEDDPDPVALDATTWRDVKKRILNACLLDQRP